MGPPDVRRRFRLGTCEKASSDSFCLFPRIRGAEPSPIEQSSSPLARQCVTYVLDFRKVPSQGKRPTRQTSLEVAVSLRGRALRKGDSIRHANAGLRNYA